MSNACFTEKTIANERLVFGTQNIPKIDPGAHYRKELKINITQTDLERGHVVVKLDPARIARVYTGLTAMLFTILKKTLRCGTGGKTYVEDLQDIISAAQREIEMLLEDGEI